MQYGFVIDNRVCIGCHACTVACKAEHLVPIGVNRTWVKYIEKGEFPNTSRSFQVSRCNHCRDAPCVSICPTTALFTREDGIVDFDNRRCIGCKSCTQACPYDAIYIDPSTHTAAKCNFCAHRIDQGLNPSCVNICPEQAIHFGDVADPDSDVAKLIAREKVAVRKPEKRTFPALYYIDGDEAALEPGATATSDSSLWSSQSRGVGHNVGVDGETFDLLGIVRRAQATRPESKAEGDAADQLLTGLLREMEKATGGEKVRRAYDQPDKGIQWGWEVAAYLLTKAVAAGMGLLCALGVLLPQLGVGIGPARLFNQHQTLFAALALIFLGLTGALLVKDLDQPRRFLFVLLRPQWKSWLVRGAYIITLYGGLMTLWLANVVLFKERTLFLWLAWPLALLAFATAGYTALLFGQCKGRDFWQSPALMVHMLLHAPLAGLAAAALLGAGWRLGLALALAANLAIIVAELYGKHPTKDGHETAKNMRRERAGEYLWFGVFGLGHLVPLLLLALFETRVAFAFAGAAALLGMALTEYLWVYIPQRRSNV